MARRLEEGKAAYLCKRDAQEVTRIRGDWVPYSQHSLAVWMAVMSGQLKDFLDALARGPDADAEVQAIIIKILQTPQQVMEWHKDGGYTHVGDGTGIEPQEDSCYGEAPVRDAAKDTAAQLTKVGLLLAEGLSRQALKVLLRNPLLEINTALWRKVKELLAVEPRSVEETGRVGAVSEDSAEADDEADVAGATAAAQILVSGRLRRGSSRRGSFLRHRQQSGMLATRSRSQRALCGHTSPTQTGSSRRATSSAGMCGTLRC
jgi:hypothetical protein